MLEDKLFQAIHQFYDDNINETYTHCFFQITEERTAIIYECAENGMKILLEVNAAVDNQMIISDLITETATAIFTNGDEIVCDHDILDKDTCKDIVGRYLNLMDIFVNFAKSDT